MWGDIWRLRKSCCLKHVLTVPEVGLQHVHVDVRRFARAVPPPVVEREGHEPDAVELVVNAGVKVGRVPQRRQGNLTAVHSVPDGRAVCEQRGLASDVARHVFQV